MSARNPVLTGIAALIFCSTIALSAQQAQTPAQGGQGQQAAPQGGSGVQVGVPGGGANQGGGGGRGRGPQGPPPGPAPRNAEGRALLNGTEPKKTGLWTPVFGITAPLLATDKTPYQPWALALYDFRQTNELEPHTRCKPSGFSRQFMTPYGVEFVEVPEEQVVYIFDVGGPHTFRTIYMDGRTHPTDFEPTYYGHSVGWWEGDTLVVDTFGYNEAFWLDRRGMPHTEKLHTLEKFTRVDSNTIRYETTVEDPGAYTAPWSSTFNFRYNSGDELFEYVCQQSNYATDLMLGDFEKIDRSSDIIP